MAAEAIMASYIHLNLRIAAGRANMMRMPMTSAGNSQLNVMKRLALSARVFRGIQISGEDAPGGSTVSGNGWNIAGVMGWCTVSNK